MKNRYLMEVEEMERSGTAIFDGCYQTLFSDCLCCEHYQRDAAGEYLCSAYPDGIPPDIWETREKCKLIQIHTGDGSMISEEEQKSILACKTKEEYRLLDTARMRPITEIPEEILRHIEKLFYDPEADEYGDELFSKDHPLR